MLNCLYKDDYVKKSIISHCDVDRLIKFLSTIFVGDVVPRFNYSVTRFAQIRQKVLTLFICTDFKCFRFVCLPIIVNCFSGF